MEVNVTVRLVNEEEEGHHEDGHAEAYHHDVHEEGDHGGYGPGHAAPVPAGGTATILVHHDIASCDAAFQLAALDHSADIRVTVRRPAHDDHDKHKDHKYQDHDQGVRRRCAPDAGLCAPPAVPMQSFNSCNTFQCI